MTEQQLIAKLQQLKQIEPSQDWVVLTKSNIFKAESFEKTESVRPAYQWDISGILQLFSQKKLAYALAVFLFLYVGIGGFITYRLPNLDSNPNNNDNIKEVKVAKPSEESLLLVKSNIEDFKEKSKNLSQISKLDSKNLSLAVLEVKEAAKEITDAIRKDPQLAKSIALDINNNKTLLDIPGGEGDWEGTLDVLYKTTFEQLIKDFDSITLTESRQESLDKIKDSYDKGKYEKKYQYALEDVLLLGAAIEE
ncbi:MAG: hypothetical protein A2908_01595 [Candidatus Staskawiczbacteria bacterium RIFCSPLOWO2_01_FULL_38_12b]|uniref:DUF5667 domain-containing protein n=1 Tax=Candidatus Staskawiczbacteria bacterium RIFCSPLOWO2_01_FULL_38_12b TaxID=1802214 RepID=A0A1G2ID64_9BACT|nr:MAG: hypothetical protein A2908_01595 [Candidatus Staskawiczbacteria bacterium RIFCSPLOWO2_01_FULL_38_12b]